MAKFKGFTTQQTYQLLSELGYDGPANQEQMDAFIAATPSAGSMLGRYTEIAKQRVEGRPLSGIGMSSQTASGDNSCSLSSHTSMQRICFRSNTSTWTR